MGEDGLAINSTSGVGNSFDFLKKFRNPSPQYPSNGYLSAGNQPDAIKMDQMKLDNMNRNTSLAESMAPWQKGFGAVQALSGLYGLYQGKKALDLQKDQFGFQKRATAEDFKAKGLAYNQELNNAHENGYALAGGTMTDAQKDAQRAERKQYEIDPNAMA